MSTRASWAGNYLTFYNSNTREAVGPFAPVVYYDDFIGAGSVVVPAAGTAESGVAWVKKIVGAAPPTVAGVADAGGGVIACALTATSEKQDAALYHDDQRCFDLSKGLIWEARVKVSVLPTGNGEVVFGLLGDWIDGPDAATYSVFFTADGSGEIFCEMDDNATDRSTTSGITVTATDWHLYRIDCTDIAAVRYYIDGVHVASGTSFAYAATGANAILQPYISAYKASGTGVGSIQVDNVRIWSARS